MNDVGVQNLPGPEELAERARTILEAHWQPEGYTVPNLKRYPHQFLWDSCFHAIVWAHLGDHDRALTELHSVFAHQSDDGFVPHMTYWRDPDCDSDFWGRRYTSCITQPPMYGHAIAELVRLGIAVDSELVERASAGLGFLFETRSERGLIKIVHPWESGCDDSPRWDAYCSGGWSSARWHDEKGRLVETLDARRSRSASPTKNAQFEVEDVGFTALTVFNAQELAEVGQEVSPGVDAVAVKALAQWLDHDCTFANASSDPRGSSRVRTLDALLPLLLRPSPLVVAAVFDQLRDSTAYGGLFGPAGVHRAEQTFEPGAYWRGPAWPQLSYLLYVAAKRLERDDDAGYLRDSAIGGALRSRFAEYWHPDTGEGSQVAPQSWTTVVAAMA